MDGRVGVFSCHTRGLKWSELVHLHHILNKAEAILVPGAGCEEGAIRLLEVQNKFKGLVEVCQGGKWKTVCNRRWDNKEARVVCRQLGFAEDSESRGV